MEIFGKELKIEFGYFNHEKGYKRGVKELTERIDKIGLQLAQLEDHAPTHEEVETIEKRVEDLEQKIAS